MVLSCCTSSIAKYEREAIAAGREVADLCFEALEGDGQVE